MDGWKAGGIEIVIELYKPEKKKKKTTLKGSRTIGISYRRSK